MRCTTVRIVSPMDMPGRYTGSGSSSGSGTPSLAVTDLECPAPNCEQHCASLPSNPEKLNFDAGMIRCSALRRI
jgi:hypothetical protein